MKIDQQAKLNANYLLMTAAAVGFSWIIHEFAHWLTGTWLGYDMQMSLNATGTTGYASETDNNLVSAAGPAITIVQALVVFWLMKKKRSVMLYPFLIVCLYMRLLAAVMSSFNPNDEARISKSIGIGTFTLPVMTVALLFLLVYTISKEYGFSKKWNAITVGLIMFFSSILILSDQFFKIQLL